MTVFKQSQNGTERSFPKRVEFYDRINFWLISASGWLFKNKYVGYVSGFAHSRASAATSS
jgi:hypothetical protein